MGNRRMYILPCGMLECDLANMIAMPALADSDHRQTVSRWVKSPVYSVLIENDRGLVLFDTGCHPDAMNGRWDEWNRKRTPLKQAKNEQIVNALAGLGFKPEDIDYVVVSHLHEDHGGGLEYFTTSKILVSDEELTQTMRMYVLGEAAGGYIRDDIRAWIDAKLNWETVTGEEEELLDGIRILNFGPGHAFGMMGLLVSLPESGSYILASDTINTAVNYGPPIRYPGLAYDTRGYERTVRRIRKLEQKAGARVLFGHDIEQYSRLEKAPRGWYE